MDRAQKVPGKSGSARSPRGMKLGNRGRMRLNCDRSGQRQKLDVGIDGGT